MRRGEKKSVGAGVNGPWDNIIYLILISTPLAASNSRLQHTKQTILFLCLFLVYFATLTKFNFEVYVLCVFGKRAHQLL